MTQHPITPSSQSTKRTLNIWRSRKKTLYAVRLLSRISPPIRNVKNQQQRDISIPRLHIQAINPSNPCGPNRQKPGTIAPKSACRHTNTIPTPKKISPDPLSLLSTKAHSVRIPHRPTSLSNRIYRKNETSNDAYVSINLSDVCKREMMLSLDMAQSVMQRKKREYRTRGDKKMNARNAFFGDVNARKCFPKRYMVVKSLKGNGNKALLPLLSP